MMRKMVNPADIDWPFDADLSDDLMPRQTTRTDAENDSETKLETNETQRIDSTLSNVSEIVNEYEKCCISAGFDNAEMERGDSFDLHALDKCNSGQGPIFGSVASRRYKEVHKECWSRSSPHLRRLVGGEWSRATEVATLLFDETSALDAAASESLKEIEKAKEEALDELVRYGRGDVDWRRKGYSVRSRKSSSVYSRETWEDTPTAERTATVRKYLDWYEDYGKCERRKPIWMVEEDYTYVDVGEIDASTAIPRLSLGARLKQMFTGRR